MTCDEYRRKFVNEELTSEEKEAFDEHLKRCESCRTFVQNYEKMKELMKARLDFKPSESLKGRVVSKVKRRKIIKRVYMLAAPTMGVLIVGAFLMFKPIGANQSLYAHLAAVGMEKLKGTPSASSTTLMNVNKIASDYDYIVKIKYASDQF